MCPSPYAISDTLMSDPGQDNSHSEAELRYYRPASFVVPEVLAGLRLARSESNPHTDHYFDAAPGRLHDAGCSLRLRLRVSGEKLVTFKKPSDEESAGEETIRAENEVPWTCPFCSEGASCPLCRGEDDFALIIDILEATPILAARAVSDGAPLRRMFAILNERREHHYEGDGQHLIMAEDDITFSDGAREERLEIELGEGRPVLLVQAAEELKSLYSDLKLCPESKEASGRRHHASLLGVSS